MAAPTLRNRRRMRKEKSTPTYLVTIQRVGNGHLSQGVFP
jgi:hypothetical protein